MSATHTDVRADVPRRDNCANPDDCPIRDVLDRVGDKWSVMIVVILGQRSRRFNELYRSIDGISQRMLTLTLRALVRDGLVSRTVHETVPPGVEYALTRLGQTLLVPLTALNEWAIAHRDDIRSARERHDTAVTSVA